MSRFSTTFILLAAAFAAPGGAAISADGESPYAGQERREIKSLSASEIQGYLDGSGMGYAKAAELNGYPGPKHVLELAIALDLNDEQAAKTGQIHETMKLQAAELGRRLVENERLLDRRFASKSITADDLKNLLEETARLQGEIRYAHLAAHLAQRAVLNESQLHQYDRLRGYGADHDHHDHR